MEVKTDSPKRFVISPTTWFFQPLFLTLIDIYKKQGNAKLRIAPVEKSFFNPIIPKDAYEILAVEESK